MNFNSIQFALFLPAVFALYWLCPPRWRASLLLFASYIFYMTWRPIYLLLILGLTVINFWFGERIWKSKNHKKAWLITSLIANVGTLAYFKYFYFMEDVLTLLTKPWFPHWDKVPIEIILPLGISFFVFEFVHYVVDVYKGSEPEHNFIHFALFPSFFPTQLAGPIKRYQDFIPQLKTPRTLSLKDFDDGVFLILTGLFKKVLLADNLALFVQGGFGNWQAFSGADFWLFAMAFEFQVFFDFSGYADIARGAALLLGFKVPRNFNFPFLANSIADFWRRWHMTLGSWLRDYVYIPLGGSRAGRINAARNVIITMAIGGLWHGAEFHFVLWGIVQGILLAIHREFNIVRQGFPRVFGFVDTKVGHVLSVVFTFLVSTVAMAMFRAPNSEAALTAARKMVTVDGFGCLTAINYPLIFPTIYLLLPAFLIGHIIINKMVKDSVIDKSPRLLKACYGATLIFLITAFAADTSPRFVYFQF